MIINNISIKKRKDTIIISADIQFKKSRKERMYFRINKKYEDFLFSDASPFLAAVLLPCMKKRESIIVEGSVSEKFLQGAYRVMSLVESWNIGLKKVSLSVSSVTKDTVKKPYGSATFFSAGVDSFYTYLKHNQKNKGGITHLILVHGFDIELENVSLFRKTEKAIQQLVDEEGVSLISVRTNIARIIEPRLVWDFAHGGALAAVSLLLRNGLQQVYIPSSVKHDMLFPYGTHPALDGLWSTEMLQLTHDGTEYSRIEKIYHKIARSSLALRYLRVCCQNRKGMFNCSRCFKCLTTMITLTAAEVLEKAETFDAKIDVERVKKMYFPSEFNYNSLAYENIALLKKIKRAPELQEALYESLERSKRFSLKRKLITVCSYIDQQYLQRKMYTFVFMMNKKQDRNAMFKFLFARGFIK